MRRAFGSLLLVTALAATTIALAQGNRSPRVRARGKPAITVAKEPRPEARDERHRVDDDADAGVADPSDDDSARADGGRASGAGRERRASGASAPSLLDGGARPSPLNPRAAEFADAGPPISPAELERVMSDIAVLRGRVAAVSDTLFKSRIVVRLMSRGDHAKIAKLTVHLDDGVVYVAPRGFAAEDEITVYEHAVSPGRHVLGVAVERRDDRGDGYRTTDESRFIVDAPENQRVEATVRLDDDSDMAADFPSSQKGSYDVRVRVRVKARP